MPCTKQIIRVARHLESALSKRAAQAFQARQSAVYRLIDRQHNLERTRELLHEARRRSWSTERLEDELLGLVRNVQEAATEARRQLEEPVVEAPDTRTLIAEMRQVEQEFGKLDVHLQQKLIAVTTESITLAGVHLGALRSVSPWNADSGSN